MSTVATAPCTWYAVHGAADLYWRVRVPAKAVGAKLQLLPEKTATAPLSTPNAGSVFPWHMTDEGAHYPAQEGNAVFTRPDQVRAAHALAMRLTDDVDRVVAEIDDNYTAQNLTAIVSDSGRQRLDIGRLDADKIRVSHMKALLVFDALIVTTKYLQNTYFKAFRELGGKQDIHLCANHVDPDDWPAPKPSSERLRVGFMGSASHHRDVALAYGALRWASDHGHEVVFCGHDPHWRVGDEFVRAYQSLYRPAGYAIDYTHIPWRSNVERSELVWPLDIAVAPLERTAFTLGRSDVKALEYTMSGAAMVLANHEVYADWRHGDTCLKANGPEDFQRQVERLCRSSRLRDELVLRATDYVRRERLISHHVDEWQEAIHG